MVLTTHILRFHVFQVRRNSWCQLHAFPRITHSYFKTPFESFLSVRWYLKESQVAKAQIQLINCITAFRHTTIRAYKIRDFRSLWSPCVKSEFPSPQSDWKRSHVVESILAGSVQRGDKNGFFTREGKGGPVLFKRRTERGLSPCRVSPSPSQARGIFWQHCAAGRRDTWKS